ncbi:MAG: FxsA family protein [Candidatus Sumerlaeia bacterium]|nr:FxsA family protein [Candidatus Sumerlaeia bacterium]
MGCLAALVPVALFVADLVLLGFFGARFGGVMAMALVFGTGILGIHSLKGRLRPAKPGASPAAVLGERAAQAIAGVFLILPGPMADLLGLALLFPPTRLLLWTLVFALFFKKRSAATESVTVKTWEWSTGSEFPGWEEVRGKGGQRLLVDVEAKREE